MSERPCADCGKVFTVGRDQAARYAAKGWAPPRRCPACRTARRKPHHDPADPVDAPLEPTTPKAPTSPKKAKVRVVKGEGDAGSSSELTTSSGLSSGSDVDYDLEDPPDVPPEAPGPATEPEVQGAFEVQCSACGEMTRVKFQPTGKRPVYCRKCFDLR